jgi:hypothetical protein
MTPPRPFLVAALALIPIAGLPAGAGAAPGGPSLEVSVIQATYVDGGTSIDPQLRDLPQLTRDQPFVRYNVYRLLDRRQFRFEEGKPVIEALANGRSLQVVLEGTSVEGTEKRYRVQTQIADPGKKAFLRSLEVTASANEPFFVAGQSFRAGTLFLELVVRP